MENILDINYNSIKKCLKHRRSHSVGFPVSVDHVFWNHVRSNIKTENITTAIKCKKEICIPISSKFISLYSPPKLHSIRRKSMDFKECDQKIMIPIMHTFEQCCNYEEEKTLKMKLNALKELQESDECRLDKLISENKVIKNKLDNLNNLNVQTNNELKCLKKINGQLQDWNSHFSNKYETMKAIYEENTEKMNKIINVSELLSNIENCELDILELHKDITSMHNDHDIVVDQYNNIKNNAQIVNNELSTKTHVLKNCCGIDLNYLNQLTNKLCDMSNCQIEYLHQNEDLKKEYSEIKNELDNINTSYHKKRKPYSIILSNIFLYILFY